MSFILNPVTPILSRTPINRGRHFDCCCYSDRNWHLTLAYSWNS